MQFRNDIQGLRAIAFLFVFIFHLNQDWLPGGFIGVDIFFVISGFLITSIILNKKEKATFKFQEFYEGRIKRIVPAYYFLLLLVTIIGLVIYLPFDLPVLKQTIKYSALFLPNVMFANGGSYFGASLSENPLLHTWSLGIEMQFYFLLPLLLIYIPKKYLLNSLLLITIFISVYFQYDLVKNGLRPSSYFSLIGRIPEFLIGSILSIGILNGKIKNNNKGFILASIGSIILILSLIFINENSLFPGFTALVPCMGVGFILISSENPITRFLSSKLMVFIGTLSYSLYLWHWPIMAFIRYRNGVHEGYTFTIMEIVFIVIFSFIFSWLSYNLFEKRFRNLSTKKFIYAISPVIIGIIGISLGYPLISKKNEIPYEFVSASFATTSHNTGLVDTIGYKGNKDFKVLLIGDSHANVLKPAFDYVGKKNGISIKTLTNDSFPSIEGIDKEEINSSELQFYKNAVSYIPITSSLIDSSDVIVLATIGFERYKSLANAVDQLAKNIRPDQKLILINTFPLINKNPLRISNGIKKVGINDFILIDKSENSKIIEKIVRNYNNVIVLNIWNSRIFKDAPFLRDTLIYYDDRHINKRGSIELGKDLEKEILRAIKPL